MSKRFDDIAKKTEELASKQRRSVEEKKAKMNVSARNILGMSKAKKKKKERPKSKVARGMEALVVIISVVIAFGVVNINIWPFDLINGGEEDLNTKSEITLFFIVAIPLFITGILITKPIIKRLEEKYGEQAW
jgi:hypothetical protein